MAGLVLVLMGVHSSTERARRELVLDDRERAAGVLGADDATPTAGAVGARVHAVVAFDADDDAQRTISIHASTTTTPG